VTIGKEVIVVVVVVVVVVLQVGEGKTEQYERQMNDFALILFPT